MKDFDLRMEIIFIPSKDGMIKVFIYGFFNLGTWGKAVAELKGVAVTANGFSKKRTIVRALTKLHETLIKKENKNE